MALNPLYSIQFRLLVSEPSDSSEFIKAECRDSTGISFTAHFKRVETAPFGLGRHAVTNRVFHHAEEHPGESKYHHDVYNDANQLRGKLPGIAVEQSADRTGDAVPTGAIGTVGEQSQSQGTPDSASTMH